MAPTSQRLRLPALLASLTVGGLLAFLATGPGPFQIPGPELTRPALHPGIVDASAAVASNPEVDSVAGLADRLLDDLGVLAHDSMEGRRSGTLGGERARTFLLQEFLAIGLEPVGGELEHPFEFSGPAGGGMMQGVNLIGVVEGSAVPGRFFVVTAHYDHLGIRGNEIYNGADDNASGTAALLALARHFREEPPRHSVLFAALDAEEVGLRGARALVANAPISLDSIVLNVNMDMVSRSDAGELYAAGTHHYPFLTPLVQEVAASAPLRLLRGHDTPDLPPGDDWTMASDHAAFHEIGIPFVYFGVEDHAGYHHPSDTFENITPDFYVDAVSTILDFLRLADERGEELLEAAGRGP